MDKAEFAVPICQQNSSADYISAAGINPAEVSLKLMV